MIPTGVFKTSDGYMNIAATGQVIWERLTHALDRTDLLERAEYRNPKLRSENRDELNAEIEKITGTATTAEWIEKLNKAGVPCGPIYTIDKVFEDAQVKHLDLVEKVPGTGERNVNLVKQPFSLSRTPSRFVAPPPEVGEHTDELLHEFGFSDAEIANLKQKKAI
jgi:crotonobetainyl-CoA:carnitine CoA-transferase CaiB-like acyl-CoA transferase